MVDETTSSAPRQFGDFEIVREIGRGGMGVVFEARQISLRRQVALKIMSAGLGITPKAIERFRREAEAAARLHHTNIVPIYTFGVHDGVSFYAMELIAGPSLDRVLSQLRCTPAAPPAGVDTLTTTHDPDSTPVRSPAMTADGPTGLSTRSKQEYFDELARMVAGVADALEHAHRHGVIHRDIKPSNLLLSPEGRLSVNDFGLARLLEQPGVTVTGEFVGTPAYMSPEQISGGRTPLDHRTDIYSLGATLYEMLTQRRPFPGERREQVLAQVLHKDPVPPRRIDPAIPRDLETICLKAMDKDPDRRYQSAAALAEDLNRYVRRFAISARRVGPLGRLAKWVRRHPAVSAASGIACLLALAAAGFAYQSWQGQVQLRQARLDTAMNKALEACHALDFDSAMDAIENARAAGASKGQLALLRGFVASYQTASPLNAIAELQQAVAMLPNELSAEALLASAYYRAGHMDDFRRSVARLGGLTPKTAEDHLFLALMLGTTDPDPRRPVDMLNEAIKMKNSVLAREARAGIGGILAETTGSLEQLQQAFDDLAVIRTMAPKYSRVAWTSFWVHARAAVVYRARGLPDKESQALRQARADAEFLDASRPGMILAYHESVGDDAAILQQYRRWAPDRLSYFAVKAAVHALVRQGDFDEARRLLDAANATGVELMHNVERGIVEALDQNPEKAPEKALAAYQEALRIDPELHAKFRSQIVLLLLGRKQQVCEVYDEASRAPHFAAELALFPNAQWNRQLWELTAGKISPEALEAAARPSRHLQ